MSLVPSITVDAASAVPPSFVAPADACVTVIVCAPTASALSDASVEKPSACPPVASRIAVSAATAAVPLVKMLPERTLPAVASRSTLKVRLPTDEPMPAETDDRVRVRRRRGERLPRDLRGDRA